jgi:hypothetical protein
VKGSTKIAIGFLAVKPSENVPDTCPELWKLSVGTSRCKTRDSKTWIENNSENAGIVWKVYGVAEFPASLNFDNIT